MAEKKTARFITLFLIFSISLAFFSCASTSIKDITETAVITEEKSAESFITMNFAGDVMAHNVNYKPGKFHRIWRGINPLLSQADLNFANIEAPVAENLPWSSYPAFNMHQSYVDEAVNAGFNVFSLSNNHTNDQYLEGIKATREFFLTYNKKHGKEIYWAGLREKSFGKMTYSLIEKNGFTILFAAVTEILNRPDYASYIDYYPSAQEKRTELKENLKALKEQNKCDLVILSVHTDEAEYIRDVTESHKKFFRELIAECGVDIIWGNHPHITKIWETVDLPEEKENGLNKAFIMYANGNTISGQRTSPSFNKAHTERDDTGDGIIMQVKMKKTDGKVSFDKIEVHFITTYITPSYQFVVKSLNDDFIHSLDDSELQNWAEYLKERKKLLEDIKAQSDGKIEND